MNRSRRRPPLNLVTLESRDVPAVFTVTSFLDLDPTGFDPATGKLPTGEITLRSAILAASATVGADTVVAPAGTYSLTLSGAEEDLGMSGDLDVTDDVTLTLTGATIDASTLGDRVLDLLNVTSTVTIVGGTIQGGKLVAPGSEDAFGGGIRSRANLILNGVTIQNNQAIGGSGGVLSLSVGWGFGGGLYSEGPLTVVGGLIQSNIARGADNTQSGFPGGSGLGGGVYLAGSGAAQLDGVRITGNSAVGGEANGSGEVNSGGDGRGGGLYAQVFANLGITRSLIDNNSAVGGTGSLGASGGGGNGGGLHLTAFELLLENTTIHANTAQGGKGIEDAMMIPGFAGRGEGGGLFLQNTFGNATIRNTTASGNLARGGDGVGTGSAFGGNGSGGGFAIEQLFSSTAGALFANVTVTDNEAAGGDGIEPGSGIGGGIALALGPGAGAVAVRSSLVAGNRADLDPDATILNPFVNPLPFTSLGSNLIGSSDGGQGFTDGVNGDQVGSISTPIDPLLTPLGFFGGSPLSLVHALNIGSPSRDTGADGGLTTDQRGAGFDRVINGQSDVGAFEVQIPATVTIAIPATVIAGQTITITGTVTDPRFPPTGTVTFFVNGNAVGSSMLDGSGNATLMTTIANPGFFTASISYGGDAAYLSASSVTGEFNALAPTSSTVAANPNTSIVTQPVSLVSVVSSTFAGTPTGTVQFFVDGSAFGSPATLDGTGTATLVVPAGFAIGSHTVESIYSGDSAFGPSSAGPTPFTVNPSPTTTTILVAPNPVFATDPIFISATVVGSIAATPTGSVSFAIDNEIVGTAVLDENGQTSFVLPAGLEIGDGAFDVMAIYSGDASFTGSTSANSILSVIPVPTATTLLAAPTSVVQGDPVMLTANVVFDIPQTPALRAGINPSILDGTVNFFNGLAMIGSVPINAGSASITVSNLPIGTNLLSAVFVPATGNLAGSSGTASVTVAPRTAVRELFAAASGFGIITTVVVYDPNGVELTRFQPYGPDYWCGAVVATGDITGDGLEDVIVGTALSGGPHVKIFDGQSFQLLTEFFAYDPAFRGGVNVAAGDLDGDGVAEIITGAGPGGGPQVNVYSFGANGALNLLNSFFAYEPEFRGGITVAVSGGLLATGPGFTGGPHVKVFSGVDANLVASYFAFDANSRSGVNVALAFDGTRTVLTAGTDAGRQPLVAQFDAISGQRIDNELVYEPGYLGGVTVTNVQTDTGELRQVFGTSLGGGPRIRVLGPGDVPLLDFFAFGEDFRGGVYVG
jgi:hypothetical protein